jgi:ArsR family transcriptional regulator, arsenate/arsenite/antimonite-responsive transcriptional repressor
MRVCTWGQLREGWRGTKLITSGPRMLLIKRGAAYPSVNVEILREQSGINIWTFWQTRRVNESISNVFDINLLFCNYRNMRERSLEQITRYADMFSAMGTEARLRIMQLLLSAHPDGLVVNEIQAELGIPNSTLSHHLDKLKNEGLINVRRESTFLRYTANTEALQELLQFLYAECCTRNQAVRPQDIVQICT